LGFRQISQAATYQLRRARVRSNTLDYSKFTYIICLGILTNETKSKLHLTECMSIGYAVICSIIDDHSRVIIHGDTTSDYINANYIDVSGILISITLRSIYTCMNYYKFMCLYRRKNDD
jgi:hypothetical protein